jgi:hypothetical protein
MTFNPIEYFYLHFLSKWEEAAPADRHAGNTQTARMARLLALLVLGDGTETVDATFRKLEEISRVNLDETGASIWMRRGGRAE